MTESGRFIFGIQRDGVTHKDFTLREQLVRDSVEIFDDTADIKRVERNDAYYMIVLLAKRLTVMGLARVTPDDLMDLAQEDYDVILDASSRLNARRSLLRASAENPDSDAGSAA